MLQEDVDGRRQEIAELQSRLTEAEALIQDLQRLIKLKDESLAALQQQAVVALARGEETPAAAPAGSVPTSPIQTPAAAQTPAQASPVGAAPVPTPAVAATPEASATVPGEAKPAVAVTSEPAASPPAEARPAVVAAPAPKVPPPVVPVAKAPVEPTPTRAPSLLESLTASPAVFWGGLAGLLAIVGGLLSVRRRRPVEQEPATASVPRVKEPSTAVGTVPLTTASVSQTSVSEISLTPTLLEPRSEGSRGEDPMAEVNVYLAYERFDQAEALVREAIADYPDRQDYRLKLLEVHHAAKNADAFERDADQLREAVGDDSPMMEKARAWWLEIAPGRGPLLAGGAVATADLAAVWGAGAPADVEHTLRLSADELRAALEPTEIPSIPAPEDDVGILVPSGDVDFDLGLEAQPEEPSSRSIDFDLDLAGTAAATAGAEEEGGTASAVDLDVLPADLIASAVAEATESLDLDLAEEEPREPTERPSESLDFELEETLQPVAASAESGSVPTLREPSLDLSLEPLSGPIDTIPLTLTRSSAAPYEPESVAVPPATLIEESGFDLEPGPVEPGSASSTDTLSEPTVAAAGAEAEETEVPGLDFALEPYEAPSGPSAGRLAAASEGLPEEVLATLAPAGRADALAAGEAAGAAPGEIDFELDLDLGEGEADEASFFLEGDASGMLDEVGTKLDLARAYIDMGDAEGARGILSEVLSEGNDTQRGEARSLLGKLAS
jgi:pilus assembly protein FimV